MIEPPGAHVDFGDARLHHLFLMRPEKCATVTEYARSAGIDVGDTLELLSPAIEAGIIGLEAVADTLFVDTAPSGRPGASGAEQLPPNLWEQLKTKVGARKAYALWKLIRSLEAGGWETVVDSSELAAAASGTGVTPWLGVKLSDETVAVVPYPPLESISAEGSPLDAFAAAGVRYVAISCELDALESYATAVRAWVLRHTRRAGALTVVLLEAPRFAPTALQIDDRGIHPVSVTRDERNT